MLPSTLSVLIGLVLLPLGAECVVRGSTGLALRIGITPLVIGLTVVAFGTSSPEFVVGIQAARVGNSAIMLGNVVGSNISNIALILGAAALVRPMNVHHDLVRREMPLMIGVSLLLVVLLLDGSLSRLEGLLLVLGVVAYTVASYVRAKRAEDSPVAAEFEEAIDRPVRHPVGELMLLLLGLAALLGGANLLLQGAVDIAAALGVSQTVIGLTVVAVGTSLPELATSIMSSARNEPDVAFGNVIGSNVFNILAVLGVAALIHPIGLEGLRALDLGIMVGVSALMLPLMRGGWTLSRREGALLLVGYAIYVYTLVA